MTNDNSSIEFYMLTDNIDIFTLPFICFLVLFFLVFKISHFVRCHCIIIHLLHLFESLCNEYILNTFLVVFINIVQGRSKVNNMFRAHKEYVISPPVIKTGNAIFFFGLLLLLYEIKCQQAIAELSASNFLHGLHHSSTCLLGARIVENIFIQSAR